MSLNEIVIDYEGFINKKLHVESDSINKNFSINKKSNQNIIYKKVLENPENASKFLKKNNIYNESFELVKYVGSGSESVVHLINIMNKKTKEKKGKAIIKILFNIRNIREARNEANISNKLKNENIINSIWNSQLEKKKPGYIIMEEAHYGDIRSFQKNFLKRLILSESMICFLAYQILNGINYCHKCKIAHLDIKLKNIVINNYLNAKLIDFSISLDYKNKDKNDEIKLPCRGTNFYISKEVLLSEKIKVKDLNKVDLYSFGVVLYNLAFNRFPYNLTHGDEDNYDIILKKITDSDIDFKNSESYSNYFLDFMKNLLEKDINKRISIEDALNHYWIKGATILLDEKEKCSNQSSFISYLITDHIKSFNDYIKKK